MGRSRPYIANAMRLLKLEPVVKEMLKRGELTISQGKLLLSIKDGNKQIQQARRMVKEGQTIEETREETKVIRPKRSSYYGDIEEKLMDRLGTKTLVKGNMNRGQLVIDYHSKDDLMRIYDLIMGGELID